MRRFVAVFIVYAVSLLGYVTFVSAPPTNIDVPTKVVRTVEIGVMESDVEMWLLILTFYSAEPGPTPPKVEMAQVTEAQCKALVDNLQTGSFVSPERKVHAYITAMCVSRGGEVYKN